MNRLVHELNDRQLDDVCGSSLGSFRFLNQIFMSKASAANADLAAAADHQRQSNDRMAQLRAAQALLGNLQVG
jgi:hypothetical protein